MLSEIGWFILKGFWITFGACFGATAFLATFAAAEHLHFIS